MILKINIRLSLTLSFLIYSEGEIIWIENKRTKQQWQNVVKDISEHGPSGFPAEAIFAFMKVVFADMTYIMKFC